MISATFFLWIYLLNSIEANQPTTGIDARRIPRAENEPTRRRRVSSLTI